MTITRNGRSRVRFAAQIATYSKAPVRLSNDTINIIPSSRKMTFQSTPDSLEKNACSASVAPINSINDAPPRAAAIRWIFSVAMNRYATANAATAIQAVTFIAPHRVCTAGTPDTARSHNDTETPCSAVD